MYSVVTKPAYLTSGQTGPKDHLSSSIQMFGESDWYFCNSTKFLFMFVNPQDVSVCMSMCLNTPSNFGPSFAHVFSVALRLCWAPRRCLFVASAGITRLPSVSLSTAGTPPAAWLCWRAASSAAGSQPARRLPPKHVDAHAAFSSAAKLFLSKSWDQGPQKVPACFSLRSLSILPTGKLLRAWKFHSNYSQV